MVMNVRGLKAFSLVCMRASQDKESHDVAVFQNYPRAIPANSRSEETFSHIRVVIIGITS